jgi:hypothetical protein
MSESQYATTHNAYLATLPYARKYIYDCIISIFKFIMFIVLTQHFIHLPFIHSLKNVYISKCHKRHKFSGSIEHYHL